MSYNRQLAHELTEDGILFENGVLVISGSASPTSISVTGPTVYYRTNGERWYNDGSGWQLPATSNASRNMDGGFANSVYTPAQRADGGGA